MKRTYLRRMIVPVLAVTAISSRLAFAENAPPSALAADRLAPALASLDGRLEAERQKRNLPSVSVAIVRDRDIIYRNAFGYADLEKKTRVTTDTVYPVGSVTKVFCATALMQLVERGVVRLDDPLSKYVPEYKPVSPFLGVPATTLRQLASHTSGLPRDAGINFWMNYTMAGWIFTGGKQPMKWYGSKEELLPALSTVEFEYVPNTEHRYSNLGMSLLGIALERASGQTYADYMSQHVFRPLGMTHSGFVSDDAMWAKVPTGYVNSPVTDKPLVAPRWQLGSAMYSGGIASTPEDLAKFLSLQFQDAPPGGAQILTRSSLSLMQEHARLQTGLGWWGNQMSGHEVIVHHGGHVGYLATMVAIPDLKLGVVVMTNSYNPIIDDNEADKISRIIVETLAPLLSVQPGKRPFEPASVDLKKYAGYFEVPGGDARMNIDLVDGKLWMTIAGSPAPKQQLFPVAPDCFSFAEKGGASVLYEKDDHENTEFANFAMFRFKRVH